MHHSTGHVHICSSFHLMSRFAVQTFQSPTHASSCFIPPPCIIPPVKNINSCVVHHAVLFNFLVHHIMPFSCLIMHNSTHQFNSALSCNIPLNSFLYLKNLSDHATNYPFTLDWPYHALFFIIPSTSCINSFLTCSFSPLKFVSPCVIPFHKTSPYITHITTPS